MKGIRLTLPDVKRIKGKRVKERKAIIKYIHTPPDDSLFELDKTITDVLY